MIFKLSVIIMMTTQPWYKGAVNDVTSLLSKIELFRILKIFLILKR